jgi:hypothetical protein
MCKHTGRQEHSWVRHYTTSRKVAGSISVEVNGFFSWINHSSRTMSLDSTQLLREMSTGNLPEGKGRQEFKADNLTAICEPTVWEMWEPRRLNHIEVHGFAL